MVAMLTVLEADITTLHVDAIVNAANNSLLGGGVYGYPVEQAAKIAVETVRETLKTCPGIEKIVFCCFSEKDRDVYERLVG